MVMVMRKMFCYLFFVFILSFVFVNEVSAECSYQERKALLNEAKGVDIGYDIITEKIEEAGLNPDSGEKIISTMEEYTIKFYVTNLSENLYIRYYNLIDDNEYYITKNDLVDGVYYFEDKDYLNLYTYYFEFRSNNSNCLGDILTTKKVVKPIYNSFEMFSICHYEGMENYKYCQKFITKSFNKTENDFITEATEYYESLNQTDNTENNGGILSFIVDYWYYGVVVICVVLIIIVLFLIRKKRSEI